jgi:hypothetical protein
LMTVDLATASARPVPVNGLASANLRAYSLSPDAKSIIAAFREQALSRILRIPLDGSGVSQELFTVTSDVWALDAATEGSILVSPLERPAELVSYSRRGTQPTGQLIPTRIASFPELYLQDMVIVLTDGRAVVPAEVSGVTRLMAVERGKTPEPLVNTPEMTAAPMTAMPGNRIAFMIGPNLNETIAVADASNGRISVRTSPGKGFIQSLAASPDGRTLYFTAGGSVWAIAIGGGDATRICAGDWVVWNPSSGRLVVGRAESSQITLFDVSPAGGSERPIPFDRTSPLFNFFISPASIGSDGQMLVALNVADSWFNPLALLDLKTGRITRLAGDNASDLHSAAWTPDGGIIANRLGLVSTIWKFTPQGK